MEKAKKFVQKTWHEVEYYIKNGKLEASYKEVRTPSVITRQQRVVLLTVNDSTL